MSNNNLFSFDIKGFIGAIDKIMADVAKDFGIKMQEKFLSEIQEFYASYTPSSYKRTYTMFRFSSGYGNGETFKKNGNLDYTAGIIVSPRYVSGNPYAKNHGIRVTPEDIFEISYEKGIHGFNRNNIYMRRKVTNLDKSGYVLPRDPVTGEPTTRVTWVAKSRNEMYIPGFNIRKETVNGVEKKYNLTLNSIARREADNYKNAYRTVTGKNLNRIDYRRYFKERLREAKRNYNPNDHVPKPKGGHTFRSPDVTIRAYYKELGKQVGEKMDAAFIELMEGL